MAEEGGALKECVDIISEILARLPAKSLMRFRCVSKPWRALIANPYFVKKHLRYTERGIGCSTSSKLLFSLNPPQSLDYEALKDLDDQGGDAQIARIDLDFPVRISDCPKYKITILGSCHGLVCVLVEDKSLVLWNPCTRESMFLPNPPSRKEAPYTWYKVNFYGFGYDSTTDDYKVVVVDESSKRFSFNNDPWEVMSHHLSLKNGSWRCRTLDVPGLVHGELTGQGLLLNGALHWYDPFCARIKSYILAAEEFEEIVPSPPDDIRFDNIIIFKNCLCGYQIDKSSRFFSLWMMKEFGVRESWTQIIKFSLENVRFLRPLCILENGAIFMTIPDGIEVVLFNQNTERGQRTVFKADLNYQAAIYTETLAGFPSNYQYCTHPRPYQH